MVHRFYLFHNDVCLCLNIFFIKDFSGTSLSRILKFGTNIEYGLLYCVRENPHPHVYHSLWFVQFCFSPESFSPQISKLCLFNIASDGYGWWYVSLLTVCCILKKKLPIKIEANIFSQNYIVCVICLGGISRRKIIATRAKQLRRRSNSF